MSAPVVAVLGLGEAGARIAADLVAAGVEVHGLRPAGHGPGRRHAGRRPARRRRPEARPLALTTASTALAAAESALPGLGTGAVYADLNTAAPR